MSNNNTLLLVAAAAAAFVVMSKRANPAAVPAPAGPLATNVNNQLWTSILGGAWKALVRPSDSTSGFLQLNNIGQVVTSDGKPVDSSLPAISSAISNSGYTNVDTSAPDGTNWLSQMAW